MFRRVGLSSVNPDDQMPKHLLFCGLLLVFCDASAQSNETNRTLLSPAAIEARCKQELPRSGYILLPAEKGGYTKCACVGLRSLSLGHLDSLRKQRTEQVLMLYKTHAYKVAELPEHEGRTVEVRQNFDHRTILKPDTSMLLFMNASCPQEARLVRVLERIVATLDAPLNRLFKFNYADEPGTTYFLNRAMFYSTGVNEVDIYIPRGLVFSEFMTDELLTFLLLHEIGHIMTLPDNCEARADRWAVTEGLTAYYGDDLTIALIPSIVDQFEGYRGSVYTGNSVLNSTTKACLSGYPRQECRMNYLANGLWQGYSEEELQTGFGYPEYCWAGPTGVDTIPDPEWGLSNCCQKEAPCPEQALRSCTPPWKCLIADYVVERLCGRIPLSCPQLVVSSRSKLLPMVKNFEKQEKRMDRSIDQLVRSSEDMYQKMSTP